MASGDILTDLMQVFLGCTFEDVDGRMDVWEENLRGLPTRDVSSTPVGMGLRCGERKHDVHSDRVIHVF